MSHGTSIYVYNVRKDYFRKRQYEIKQLLEQTDIGTKEKRNEVAEYINNMLYDDGPTEGFAFWNHREGQDISYDVLAELWLAYGKIVAHTVGCVTYVSVDFYKDSDAFYQLVDNKNCVTFTSEERKSTIDFVDKLELKKKIEEGKKAQKQLSERETE